MLNVVFKENTEEDAVNHILNRRMVGIKREVDSMPNICPPIQEQIDDTFQNMDLVKKILDCLHKL